MSRIPVGKQIKPKILSVFRETGSPMTVSNIIMFLREKFNLVYTWNTVNKYVGELSKDGFLEVAMKGNTAEGRTAYTFFQVTVKALTEPLT